MAKGISIPIASDTREFASGVQKGVIKPLSDLDTALDDVARAGDAAGDKLERSLDGASRETSDFKKQQQELARTMATTQAQGTRAVELNARQRRTINTTAVKQAGATVKQSVASDAQSMATSTEGALSTIGNTAGVILSSFGPIGVGIGIAVGTATGIVSGLLAKGTEKTKAFKASVKELTSELINVRDKGGPSLEYVNNELKELATNSEAGEVKLTDLLKAADGNVDRFKDLAQAYAGNTEKLDQLVRQGDLYLTQLQDEQESLDVTSDSGNRRYGVMSKQIVAQESYNKFLNEAKDKADLAAEAEKNYLAAGGDEMKAKADAIKTINTAYDEAAGAAQTFIDKESGVFDVDRFLTAFKAREKAIEDYQSNLAKVDLSPEAKAFIDSKGVEAASAFLSGYMGASDKKKKELNRIWSEAGKENSGSYQSSLKTGLGGSVRGPRVRLDDPDVKALLRNTQKQLDRTQLVVKAGVFARDGQRLI